MNALTDSQFLRPRNLIDAERIEVVDAINLVVYAKLPLKSILKGFDLIAGFVHDPVSGSRNGIHEHEVSRLRRDFNSFADRLRFPLATEDFEPLYDRLLVAGHDCLPHFFHDEHLLVDKRRRAAMFLAEYNALQADLRAKHFIIQLSETERAYTLTLSAWMSRPTLASYLEDRGVWPWWSNKANAATHSRIERILPSDAMLATEFNEREAYVNSRSLSYTFAEMLLRRCPIGRRHFASAALTSTKNKDAAFVEMKTETPAKQEETSRLVQRPKPDEQLILSEDKETRAAPSLFDEFARAKTLAKQRNFPPERERALEQLGPEVEDGPDYISKEDIANLLRVHTNTVDNWRKRPDFPKEVKLGPTTLRWERRAVMAWIETRGQRGE